MDYQMRPSITRTNARFRGPTESEKYTNFVGEAAHDLTLLGKVLDHDDFIFSLAKGQANFINDNLAVYFNGENADVTSNIGTSGKMTKILGSVFTPVDLSTWTPDGCTITKLDNDTFNLTMSGSPTTPVRAIRKTLPVTEGQIIKLTMYFKKLNASITAPGFMGSKDINQGDSSLVEFNAVTGDFIMVEHYLYCTQKETITLEIYGKDNAGDFTESSLQIKYPTIQYVEVSEFKLEPTNTSMKRRINVLEDQIENIMNNL